MNNSTGISRVRAIALGLATMGPLTLAPLTLVPIILVPMIHAPAAFAQERHAFTQPQLDQMLASIALYPDSLVSQILMAATYPLEVVQAARWSKSNPGANGDAAVRAVETYDWDPSVKSLVAFPQILATMDQYLEWTEDLGEAFLAQESQVMDTIQSLRQRAYASGTLNQADGLNITMEGPEILIEPADPQFVYLPYYDPLVAFGPWWWPTFQPVRWNPWPGYAPRRAPSARFYWGTAVRVSPGFFFGRPDWRRRQVNVVQVNNYYVRDGAHVAPRPGAPEHRIVVDNTPYPWVHEPEHRRGAPFHEAELRQRFAQNGAAPPVQIRTPGGQPAEQRRASPNARVAEPQAPPQPQAEQRAQPQTGRGPEAQREFIPRRGAPEPPRPAAIQRSEPPSAENPPAPPAAAPQRLERPQQPSPRGDPQPHRVPDPPHANSSPRPEPARAVPPHLPPPAPIQIRPEPPRPAVQHAAPPPPEAARAQAVQPGPPAAERPVPGGNGRRGRDDKK